MWLCSHKPQSPIRPEWDSVFTVVIGTVCLSHQVTLMSPRFEEWTLTAFENCHHGPPVTYGHFRRQKAKVLTHVHITCCPNIEHPRLNGWGKSRTNSDGTRSRWVFICACLYQAWQGLTQPALWTLCKHPTMRANRSMTRWRGASAQPSGCKHDGVAVTWAHPLPLPLLSPVKLLLLLVYWSSHDGFTSPNWFQCPL